MDSSSAARSLASDAATLDRLPPAWYPDDARPALTVSVRDDPKLKDGAATPPAESGADLASGRRMLSFFDRAVRADGAAPGFKGRIAIGVAGDAETTWWAIDASVMTAKAWFAPDRPADCSVTVLLDESDAAALMSFERLPDRRPGQIRIEGDRGLWAAFLERYLKKKGFVDLVAARR